MALPDTELFEIHLADGQTIKASEMKMSPIKAVQTLAANPKALKLVERYAGKALSAQFVGLNGAIKVQWTAVLRDSSHYLRQEFKISTTKPVEFKEIVAMQYNLGSKNGEAKVAGNTRGSMITNDKVFAALETPMGINTIESGSDDGQVAQGVWHRETTLNPGETWEVSSVLGLFAPDQQRRSFLAYLERERAVPYRPFIHYNSWYELNIDRNNDSDPAKRMTEAQCLAVVKDWEEKFYKKRGVTIDAFVWDDGWDDFNSLWGFHKMFPQGFKNINALAAKQKAGIGAWLGPVGGYGSSKAQRLGYWNSTHPGNKIDNFQLSNKEYFDAFVGRCSQMVKDYNMKYFKFDGISAIPHAKGPADGRDEDAEGILKVVNALRSKRGDLFINCTVGTWASPFWQRYADSVWRQEGDFDRKGAGDPRDQWITYRDRLVHEVFVEGSPLMPINSLMTHGIIVSKFGPPSCMPREPENVKKEIRCAFASGSALQELYLDRDLLEADNEAMWDELAKGVKWIRRNADVLDDVHWVGGNPWDNNEGNIYGWASWNPTKATLGLRNSADQEKTLTTTLREVLDIPKDKKGTILFKDSYDDQRSIDGFTGKAVDIDQEVTFTLQPFEVLVYEGGKLGA